MAFIRAEDVSEILDELEEEQEKNKKLNAKLKELLKASSKTSRTPLKSKKSAKSKTSSGDKKVGFVCVNAEFYGLTVYENSRGWYVNDEGQRRYVKKSLKISKEKPN